MLMVKKDRLWKGIIEDLVVDFLHYFYTDFVNQIDFTKGFKFLDKELERLFPQAVSRNRHADKLFQAYLKNGKEQWFLIHVEIQGYPDKHFARRMFEYAYRIKDKYQGPLTALAIYTDKNRKFHFKEFHEKFFNSELIYRFQTYVLIDQKPGSFRKANNLFALVMEVAYKELFLKKREDIHILNLKTETVRYLYRQGVAKEKIQQLLDFIKYYIRFEQQHFFDKFEEEIEAIIKSRKAMGIREVILNEYKEIGFAEGEQAGEEKGIAKGFSKGMHLVISRAWKKGIPITEIADLTNMPIQDVQAIVDGLTSAGASEEEE